MHIDIAVPAHWPSQARLDEVWRNAVQQVLDSLPELVGGYLRPSDDSSVWRLVAGQHLAPGARYQAEDPDLTVGTLTVAVDGTPADRQVSATYGDLPGHGDRSARLRLDGLGSLRSLRSDADLHELTWHLDADAANRRLTADVELPWARAEVRVTLTHELRLTLSIHGTGIWRPTVAPILAAAKHSVEQGALETLKGLATTLDTLETEGRFVLPSSQPPIATQIAACEAAWDEVRRRLVAAEDTTAAEPWWRRSGRRWRAAYDALPPPDHPAEGFTYLGPVGVREARIADSLARKRFGRRAQIERSVTLAAAADLDFLRGVQQQTGSSLTPRPGGGFRLRDEDFAALPSLASPWSILERTTDAPDPV